jgi:hypothetical protein
MPLLDLPNEVLLVVADFLNHYNMIQIRLASWGKSLNKSAGNSITSFSVVKPTGQKFVSKFSVSVARKKKQVHYQVVLCCRICWVLTATQYTL